MVNGIRDVLANLEDIGDHSFHIIGGPAVSLSFKEAAQKDVSQLVPIVFGLAFTFLALFFRRVSGVFLPLLVVVGTLISAMATGGYLGFSINKISNWEIGVRPAGISHKTRLLNEFSRIWIY